jgi:hypothetical protein
VSRRIRVLHCPTNVGGHPAALAAAERELGLDSRSVAFDAPPGGHAADEILRGKRAIFEVRRAHLLIRALREADVVHFNFGRTILPTPPTWPAGAGASLVGRLLGLRDLPLLRKAGKGIVVTFQGDDARQGDVLRARYDLSIAGANPGYYFGPGDKVKRRTIGMFARYAHRIYFLNPDLAHVLPARAEFVPYASVDSREWLPGPTPEGRRLIVHAPTDRAVKGTGPIIEAVNRLRAAGIELDFELVEGRPLADARALYERASIGVDQLYAGWYGGFAVELMALGKPVVAFIRQQDLAVVPEPMRRELPVISATPDSLVDVLSGLIGSDLDDLGRRSRAFVERWHDPVAIAARMKEDYEQVARRP